MLSGRIIFEPFRTSDGQWVVSKMSAELAPRSALVSSSVWKGRYFSLDRPAVILGSRDPPRFTMRIPSDVFVVDLFPRK